MAVIKVIALMNWEFIKAIIMLLSYLNKRINMKINLIALTVSIIALILGACIAQTVNAQNSLPPEYTTIYFNLMPYLDLDEDGHWDITEPEAIGSSVKCTSGGNSITMITSIVGAKGEMQTVEGAIIICNVRYWGQYQYFWSGRYVDYVEPAKTYDAYIPLYKTRIYVPSVFN